MKLIKLLFVLCLCFFAATNSFAQKGSMRTLPFSWWHGSDYPEEGGVTVSIPHKNCFKINISPLSMGIYSGYFERAVTNKLSLSLGARYAPELAKQFNSTVTSLIKNVKTQTNQNVDSLLNIGSLKVSNLSFSGEVRVYPGKNGVFRGAYLGLYANSGTTKLSFPLAYKDNGVTKYFTLDGKFNTFAAGLTIGKQFTILNRITIDLVLIGGGVALSDGTLTAGFSPALSQNAKDDIKTTANNILAANEIKSIIDAKVDVDPNGSKVTVRTNTTLPSIKSALCIGFRF